MMPPTTLARVYGKTMRRITSQVVQPTPKALSLNIGGTVRNTSRMVAAMNGTIITASTM
jgi:hypothetical protein